MEYFAATTLPELGAVLAVVFGAFGTLLVGFYKYAQARENDFEKSREIASAAYKSSTDTLASALERVAVATERSANEAKQRNGHLAEMIVEQGNQTEKIATGAIEAILEGVKVQKIGTQEVEHQHIISKEE